MFQLKGWRLQPRGSLRYMHVINMRLYVNVCDRLYSCTRYSCRVHRFWNLFRVMEDQQKRQRASLVEEESVDLEEQLQADCDLSVHVDGLGWGMKLWCGSCRSFENSDIPNHTMPSTISIDIWYISYIYVHDSMLCIKLMNNSPFFLIFKLILLIYIYMLHDFTAHFLAKKESMRQAKVPVQLVQSARDMAKTSTKRELFLSGVPWFSWGCTRFERLGFGGFLKLLGPCDTGNRAKNLKIRCLLAGVASWEDWCCLWNLAGTF